MHAQTAPSVPHTASSTVPPEPSDEAHKPPTVRLRMSQLDFDEFFSFQPSRTSDLPDPRPLVENLTRSVVEIILGVRDVQQIARFVTETVYHHLSMRASSAQRARAIRRPRERAKHVAFRLGGVTLCHAADGVIEAAIVVHTPVRSRAVALRLEGLDGVWRATAVHVL